MPVSQCVNFYLGYHMHSISDPSVIKLEVQSCERVEKNLSLEIFYLPLSIVLMFLIAAYPVCYSSK